MCITYGANTDRTINQVQERFTGACTQLHSFAVDSTMSGALQIIALGCVSALFPMLSHTVVTEAKHKHQYYC